MLSFSYFQGCRSSHIIYPILQLLGQRVIPWPNHISIYYVLQRFWIFCHNLFGNFNRVTFRYARTFLHHLTDHNPDHLPSHSWDLVVFLSPMTVSASDNLYQGIIKVSTQSMSWLWQLLEEVEGELLGEEMAKMQKVLARHQQMSCWFQKSVLQKNTQKVMRNTM